MDEELLINVSGFETRVALMQNHALAEVHLQRSGPYSLTGNIYKGRVERILPGMQAAFVNVGLGRPGFLHARDIDMPRIGVAEPDPVQKDIRDLVHEGQALLVQVAKDPMASKGARLTTNLALASRYLVLMPLNSHLGISQRIDDEAERERLRVATEAARIAAGGSESTGLIVRTAAEGVASALLEADVRVLMRVWQLVDERQRGVDAPSLVYQELPLHTRIIRDFAGPDLKAVKIDERRTFERVRDFVDQFLPEHVERVQHYVDPVPLFERYGVEDEIERALHSRVALRCGGHLVIEQTEAMTTIDVKTGAYVGARNLEDTVFRTNLEAAAIIPRQLRLRNLGGIVVVDFIDMEDEEHRRQVLRALENACEGDPARIRVSGVSELGLVQISRKRTRESLRQQLCERCATCGGRGVVKTAESVCIEIFRALLRSAGVRQHEGAVGSALPDVPGAPSGEYLVQASQGVIDRLLDEERDNVACVAEQIGRAIRFQVEPSYGPEQFDLVLVQAAAR
jgi:ribonuclease G